MTPERLARLTHASRVLDEILNRAPSRHAPYVGESAFATKAGIHASAILKDPGTYEHVLPDAVGNRRHVLVSKQAGKSNVLDALARMRTAGTSTFDESRFIGAFRAQGLLIPVWQLQPGSEADELGGPLSQFAAEFDKAIATTEPLTAEEKRARAGIVSRQVTLR